MKTETLANRVNEIRKILKENMAAFIISPQNRFYLTDFETSDGFVYISEKSAIFMTDSRYIEKAESVVKSMDTVLLTSQNEQLSKIIKDEKIKTVLIETDYITVNALSSLKSGVGDIFSTSSELTDKLLLMRSKKELEEINRIKEAQRITDLTFSYILERISAGRTEKEIMLDMEFFMRKSGSEGIAFDFIVVSGKNSSLPHGVPTDKKIEKGDFITMDFGAVIKGYRSDMTRTVAVGEITSEQKSVYDTVLKAQKAALDFAALGKNCSDVDKAARDIIDATEFKDTFGHALGHSVGIDIHESPSFSPRSKDILKCGNVMTIEPGIYLKNKFGVRIEDMIYITENGNDNLTKSRKDLIIL